MASSRRLRRRSLTEIAARAIVLGLCLVTVSCTSGVRSPSSQSPRSALGGESLVSCTASGLVASDGAIQGDAANGELWVLPPGPVPLLVGNEVKVVIRITGAGELTASAEGPGGERVAPNQPLAAHASSDFARPGDEWGVFFTFDRPGCWTVLLDRGTTTGSFKLSIQA